MRSSNGTTVRHDLRRPARRALAALGAGLAVAAPGATPAQTITAAPVRPVGPDVAWTAAYVEAPAEIALGTMAVNVWARLDGPIEAGAPAAAWIVLPGADGGEETRIEMRAVDGTIDTPDEELVATVDTYAWVTDAAHPWELRVRGAGSEPVALTRGAIRVKPRLAADDLVLLDIAGGVQAWIGSGAGGFTPSDRLEASPAIGRPAVCDLDGDGRADLVVPGRGGDIRIFRNPGHGRLEPVRSLAAGLGVAAAAVGDVDGDGRPDLVTVSPDRGLEIRLGVGDGADFAAVLEMAPEAVGLADLDGDGAAEVWVGLLGFAQSQVRGWRRTVPPGRPVPGAAAAWTPLEALPDPPEGPRGRIRALAALPADSAASRPNEGLLVLSGSATEGVLESWNFPADTQAGSEPALARVIRLPGEPLGMATGRFRPGAGIGWMAAVRDPRTGSVLLVGDDGAVATVTDGPGELADLCATDLDGDGDDDLVCAGEDLRIWINVRGTLREAGESPYLLDAPVVALVAGRWDERSERSR